MSSFFQNKKGFSMAQLIITVAVIAVLSASVLLWVDPLARIGTAKNKKRSQNIGILAAAIADYAGEHKGALPVLGAVTTDKKVLCSSQGGSNLSCDGDSQLCLIVDSEFLNYIGQLPRDPDKTSNADSGYYLQKDANGNLVVGACETYDSETITNLPNLKVSCAVYGGGYCWYLGDTINSTCDTACSALSLDCVKNISDVDDVDSSGTAFCGINKALTGDCGDSCTSAATSTPPWASDDSVECAIQDKISTCHTASGALKYPVCVCN
jgi:type II secretory pathway pseudopilin PulG